MVLLFSFLLFSYILSIAWAISLKLPVALPHRILFKLLSKFFGVKIYLSSTRTPERAFLSLCVRHTFKRVSWKSAFCYKFCNTHNLSWKLHNSTSFTITPFLPSDNGITLPKAMLSDFSGFVFNRSDACFNCCSDTVLTPLCDQCLTFLYPVIAFTYYFYCNYSFCVI